MTILVKGPYSRKDYINNIQNIENQQDDINTCIERIKNTTIMITVVVALLYCIGTAIFAWINRNEITDTTQLTMIVGLASIFIIALIPYFIAVQPYNKQKDSLYEEAKQLEKHYRDNMVEVPLSEYIDHISVKGDKVTFPPLDEIDERYIYDRCSYHLDDDKNDERQIFRLCPDFYEYDYLRTRGCGRIPITREECRMLQTKGGRG